MNNKTYENIDLMSYTRYTESEIISIRRHIQDIRNIMEKYYTFPEYDVKFSDILKATLFWFLSWRKTGNRDGAIDMCYVALISDMIQAIELNQCIHFHMSTGNNLIAIAEIFELQVIIDLILGIWPSCYGTMLSYHNDYKNVDEYKSNLHFLNCLYPNTLEMFFSIMGRIANYEFC